MVALLDTNVGARWNDRITNQVVYGFGWLILSVSMTVYTGSIPGLQAVLALSCLLTAVLIRPTLTYASAGLSLSILYAIVVTLAAPVLVSGIDALEQEALLRCRYWVFQLCYALLGMVLIRSLTSARGLVAVRRLSTALLFFLCSIAIIQVAIFSEEQAYILSAEPSQSASVLFFWMLFSTSLYWVTTGAINKYILALGLIGVVATGSKAGYVTGALLLILILRPKYFLAAMTVALLLALSHFLLPDIFAPLEKILYLYSVLSDVGLDGLSYEYQIWDSWIVRLGSFGSALLMIPNHPLGVGFGGFALHFPNYIDSVIAVNTSAELADILAGNSYATPKSYGMEFLVSTGFVGFILLLRSIITVVNRCGFGVLTICYLCMLAQSFAVELAPFLAMLVIIYQVTQVAQRKISHAYPEV